MPMKNQEDRELHAVGRLIEAQKVVEGWSEEDIARRARARGLPMTKQNLGRIKNEAVKTVSAETIEALAVGLNVPEQRVIAAYMDMFGFPLRQVPGFTSTEAAIRADVRLSSDDKANLLALLGSMIRRKNTKQTIDADIAAGDNKSPTTELDTHLARRVDGPQTIGDVQHEEKDDRAV